MLNKLRKELLLFVKIVCIIIMVMVVASADILIFWNNMKYNFEKIILYLN